MNEFEELFELGRESASPGQWSKAVTLSRNAEFVLERQDEAGMRIKVLERTRALGTVVELDLRAGDWQADCGCDEDPCLHVLASLIATKNKVNFVEAGEDSSAESLRYRIERRGSVLAVVREIGSKHGRTVLTRPLLDYTGGLQTGRTGGGALHPTKEDFQIERSLEKDGTFPAEKALELCSALSIVPHVELDNEPLEVRAEPVSTPLVLEPQGSGWRLRPEDGDADPSHAQSPRTRFRNGVVLEGRVLAPLTDALLDERLRRAFEAPGLFFPEESLLELIGDALPQVKRAAEVRVAGEMPALLDEEPRVVFLLEKEGEALSVLPRLLYGEPPALEILPEGVRKLRRDVTVRRDRDAERMLARRLQGELHLQPGRLVRKNGAEAVAFLSSLERWEVSGEGEKAFAHRGSLAPAVSVGDRGVEIEFLLQGEGGEARRADPSRVFEAWQANERLVPLLEGGWAEIPRDWLEQYGRRIMELQSLTREAGGVEPRHQPILMQFAEEVGAPLSDSLRALKERLLSADIRRAAALPPDLQAELRSYQHRGVDWLDCLKALETGGILADDMGLGKTLQVLCVMRRRTLVVAPTSVLDSWCEQLERFRPALTVCRYHGAKRAFSESADVVLTTYALLRLELERFLEEWDMVVLDEAQQIKNPESATAQAAFRLRGRFKVALSGTPLENRLEDLWSQLRFAVPGLLGERSAFDADFARPIARGDGRAVERLRLRIRPFLLRRLKRDVAAELPPRTEVVLRCELDTVERELYQSIYLSSQPLIRRAIESGSVFQALEVLLRLRQVCAHRGLLPSEQAVSSSKTELLMESLRASKEAGHRALVFSQWTSMLDLLEPHLEQNGLTYVRLDGATKDRKGVVEAFQQERGADLMLLSLKAGGVGITLTAADHIYLFDSWWNPAVEDQAADRAHRIGQTRPVLIHRLIVEDSIEENVLKLQEKKRELADALLEGGAAAGGLSRDDLLVLFGGIE